ncbi:DnaT-like ssDNA-binding protein [Paenibacillus sp. FSL H7-0735]|uniref:DnaT-like ssDNA-binding protein n=1 Tax=Paenibacillus sp. FSL H7-0735 TaxID=2954736 RepID=UPI0030F67986
MLVVGINSYVTIEEIKSLCLEKEILSLQDEDLIFLAKKAFDWLENIYTVFRYPKYDKNQSANFPLSVNGSSVPLKVKKAQVIAMNIVNEMENMDSIFVSGKTVGQISENYQLTGKSNIKINDSHNQIVNYLSDYMVNFLC